MLPSPLPAELDGWLKVLNPGVLERLGHIRHALFDFDGTLSVLRQGWEDVMVPLMAAAICGDSPPDPAVAAEVRAYVDASTGILTIRQMEWLVAAVRRRRPEQKAPSAAAYKALYLRRLSDKIRHRIEALLDGTAHPHDRLICGAPGFLQGLQQRGVTLYLCSGTDHADVFNEARALGLLPFFTGGVFGALDEADTNDKAAIIRRILASNRLQGEALLVVGDGPVELRAAVSAGAIALGVASDEVIRSGWNERKLRRLTQAGADLLVPDFLHYQGLLNLLFTR